MLTTGLSKGRDGHPSRGTLGRVSQRREREVQGCDCIRAAVTLRPGVTEHTGQWDKDREAEEG